MNPTTVSPACNIKTMSYTHKNWADNFSWGQKKKKKVVRRKGGKKGQNKNFSVLAVAVCKRKV